jgi:hypothetical protein
MVPAIIPRFMLPRDCHRPGMTIYMQLSQRHLHPAVNPLGRLTLRTTQEERLIIRLVTPVVPCWTFTPP